MCCNNTSSIKFEINGGFFKFMFIFILGILVSVRSVFRKKMIIYYLGQKFHNQCKINISRNGVIDVDTEVVCLVLHS